MSQPSHSSTATNGRPTSELARAIGPTALPCAHEPPCTPATLEAWVPGQDAYRDEPESFTVMACAVPSAASTLRGAGRGPLLLASPGRISGSWLRTWSVEMRSLSPDQLNRRGYFAVHTGAGGCQGGLEWSQVVTRAQLLRDLRHGDCDRRMRSAIRCWLRMNRRLAQRARPMARMMQRPFPTENHWWIPLHGGWRA